MSSIPGTSLPESKWAHLRSQVVLTCTVFCRCLTQMEREKRCIVYSLYFTFAFDFWVSGEICPGCRWTKQVKLKTLRASNLIILAKMFLSLTLYTTPPAKQILQVLLVKKEKWMQLALWFFQDCLRKLMCLYGCKFSELSITAHKSLISLFLFTNCVFQNHDYHGTMVYHGTMIKVPCSSQTTILTNDK